MSNPDSSRDPRRIIVVFNILLAAVIPTACISTDSSEDRKEAISTALDRLDRPELAASLEDAPDADSLPWPPNIPLAADDAVSIAMSRDAEVRRALVSIDKARAVGIHHREEANRTLDVERLAQIAHLGARVLGEGGRP